MKFRNIVLLVAAAKFVLFVRTATVCASLGITITWQIYLALFIDFGFVLFFSFLYGEASERTNAKARTITATVLSILMVLDGAGGTLKLAVTVLTWWHLRIAPDTSFLANRVLHLVWVSLWIAFLIAFSSKRVTATSRLTPKVAGVLALFTLGSAGSAVWGSLQLHNGSAATLVSWDYAMSLFSWAALLLFFMTISGKWKLDLPIHQNIVC